MIQNETSAAAPSDELLRTLRRQMPARPLAFWEHLAVAERQASKLRALLEQLEPGASLEWLSGGSLHSVVVTMQPRWRMEGLSGMSTWDATAGHWVIGVNKGNPPARRRFTLMHEFKHVLDANRDKITYRKLTAEQREQIAEYFAACYLMPKLLVRRAWVGGVQDPEALAGLFKVSVQAMTKRLKYLQFLDDDPSRSVSSYFRREKKLLADLVTPDDTWQAAVMPGSAITGNLASVNQLPADLLGRAA